MKQSILLTLTLICAHPTFCQTTTVHNGHTIKFSKEKHATVADPMTHETKQITSRAQPIALNGEPVYTAQDLSTTPTMKYDKETNLKLCVSLFRSLKSTLETLQDGYYVLDITNAIVDTSGKLIYWQFSGIKQFHLSPGPAKYNYSDLPFVNSKIPSATRMLLLQKTTSILQHFPQMIPGTANNRAVNVTGDLFSKSNYIEVKDHHAKLKEDYWSL